MGRQWWRRLRQKMPVHVGGRSCGSCTGTNSRACLRQRQPHGADQQRGPRRPLLATGEAPHSRDAQIHKAGVSGAALHSTQHRCMGEAGIDPSAYGFHRLRAGHAIQASLNGASTEEIMRADRRRKPETVNVYDRGFNLAARNSVMLLGLLPLRPACCGHHASGRRERPGSQGRARSRRRFQG